MNIDFNKPIETRLHYKAELIMALKTYGGKRWLILVTDNNGYQYSQVCFSSGRLNATSDDLWDIINVKDLSDNDSFINMAVCKSVMPCCLCPFREGIKNKAWCIEGVIRARKKINEDADT